MICILDSHYDNIIYSLSLLSLIVQRIALNLKIMLVIV